MIPGRYDRLIDHLLVGAMITGLVLALMAMFGEGFYTSVGGIRISSRTVFRPLVVAVSAFLIALHRSDHREQQLTRLWAATRHHANAVAACLAIFVFAIAMRLSPFEASAADQYGYVSQAELWVKGSLITYEPLAAIAPWPEPAWTLSPLGYRPGQATATIVPTYPPGLPLFMAGLMRPIGRFGAYLAVPFLGSLAVVAAFLLGKRFAGPTCGLMTATLLLTSPVFLYQLKEPMSDVPVTAWWLVVIVLVVASTATAALGAGLAASAAILTRPNLVPLAAVVGVFVLGYSSPGFRTRLRHALLFSLGVLPGCVGVALFNRTLYGSPLASGYGSLSALFSVDYFWPNLARYPRWLLESETPFIVLAAMAFWLFRTPREHSHRLSWLFVGFSATLYACYAFYVPFDHWTFVRFVLPAIPLLLIMSSAVVLHLSERLPSRSLQWLLAALFFVLVAWRWEATGLQPVPAHERRYVVIGEFVRDQLPRNAIVVSMIHSGSVRYYSGRLTLRWDWLPAEWLERSLEFLRTNGYHPFLLIEDWERRQFTERFAAHTALGTLDWPPVASYSGNVRADIFDPADRRRFLTGERISTRTIGTVPHGEAR